MSPSTAPFNPVASVVGSSTRELNDELTIIRNMIDDILKYENLTDEGKQYLLLAQASTHRLMHTNTEVMKFAKKYDRTTANEAREATWRVICRLQAYGY